MARMDIDTNDEEIHTWQCMIDHANATETMGAGGGA